MPALSMSYLMADEDSVSKSLASVRHVMHQC